MNEAKFTTRNSAEITGLSRVTINIAEDRLTAEKIINSINSNDIFRNNLN